MPPFTQPHGQGPITDFENSAIGHDVGHTARQALSVDIPDFGVELEQFESSLFGKSLDLVDDIISAVVAFERETL